MADAFLDAKGMNCPLPILKAKKELKALENGQVLEIIATDPGAMKDFASFCRATGNKLLSSVENEDGKTYSFLIERVV